MRGLILKPPMLRQLLLRLSEAYLRFIFKYAYHHDVPVTSSHTIYFHANFGKAILGQGVSFYIG